MASNNYCVMAFLSFLLLALLLFTHQAFGSKSGRFIPKDYDGTDDSTSDGLCSVAVPRQDYICREYRVTTEDGFILSVQKITEGSSGDDSGKRTPVLLQHGLFVDGITWLMNSPQQSLALILADSGFDVWISNLRGTQFSQGHNSLDVSDAEFWNWSWDELAQYDLSSFINLVFNETGQKMHYIGHSMGTLIALASFSQGWYVDKIKSATLLSPIAYVSSMPNIATLAAMSYIDKYDQWVPKYNPEGTPFMKAYLRDMCDIAPWFNCYNYMSSFTGPNCCLDSSTLEFFLDNEPQPTSTRNLAHFAQTIRDGRLRKYDYGFFNWKHYRSPTPPEYDLRNISTHLPLFLSYGENDLLADVTDVDLLLNKLQGKNVKTQVVNEYAHLDFIMGFNANEVVYNRIIEFIHRNS